MDVDNLVIVTQGEGANVVTGVANGTRLEGMKSYVV